MIKLSRRQFMTTTAACVSASVASRFARSAGPEQVFDFTKPLDGWQTITGNWAVENVPGASRNERALVQRATDNEYNVILRFAEGRYYVVRANALEDNFRFYYYDRGRFMLATANVGAPELGQWHKLQITARGDRFQAWLNDRELIDHRDGRFAVGRIGLWTKTDSVTAFDALTVLPLDAG